MTKQECEKAMRDKSPVFIERSYVFSTKPTTITKVMFGACEVDGGSDSYEHHRIKLANNMETTNKTAEDLTILDLAIQEIEKQKFDLLHFKTLAVKVGLTDAIALLGHLKEEQYIKCECGHEVEHKFSHTNEDGQVTCSLCVNARLIEENKSLRAQLSVKNCDNDLYENYIKEKTCEHCGSMACVGQECLD